MPQELGPLKPKRKHPLYQHRLDAIRNGWSIIPCNGKDAPPFGWPRLACSAEALLSLTEWRGLKYMGTAVRIEGRLCVIDSDVNIPAVADAIQAALEAVDPEGYARAMIRDSGGVTLAVFYQLAKLPALSHYVTHRYTAHPQLIPELTAAQAMPVTSEEEDDAKVAAVRDVMKRLDAQKVEFYGAGHGGRYFCYEGPHSPGRSYHCWEQAPWNTKVEDLPVLRIDPAAFIDQCTVIMDGMLTRIPEPELSTALVVYDLRPDMLFYPKGAQVETIEALTEGMQLGVEHGIRGCAPWTRMSKSEANCKLYVSSSGRVVLTDWTAAGANHYMASEQPLEHSEMSEEGQAALAAALGAGGGGGNDNNNDGPTPAPPPPPEGSFLAAIEWMIATFAHCKGDLVMPIRDVDASSAVSVNEFNHRYQKYSQQRAGSRPGVLSYASRVWLGHRDMVDLDGYDMRPDMEFPLYREGGKRFKNTYRPPHHHGEGEVGTLLDFMQHLVPASSERNHYLDSVAYKWRNPAIPGLATIMVAESEDAGGVEQSGTGRGTWFKILEKVWGWHYAKRIDWEIVTGSSSQATFTGWQADIVLAFVEESRDKTSSGYTERRGVYEYLKMLIDTAPRRAIVRDKYGKPRNAMLNASYLFATNHADALQIPASDRRFLVISNGGRLTEEMARAIYAWMDKPGNIAALVAWLQARDLSHYDPMAAPMQTEARERMVELAVSEMDRLVREAAGCMPGFAFTRSQVLTAARNLAEDRELFQGSSGMAQFAQVFKRVAFPLSMPGVTPKQQRRFRTRWGQERGYAKTKGWARHCDTLDHDAVKTEIELNDPQPVKDEGGDRKPDTPDLTQVWTNTKN